MGNCVSDVKEQKAQYKKQKFNTGDKMKKNQERDYRSNGNILLVPCEAPSKGSHKNLFKTFSDWSDESPQANAIEIEINKARVRRGSENVISTGYMKCVQTSNITSQDSKQHKPLANQFETKNSNANRVEKFFD